MQKISDCLFQRTFETTPAPKRDPIIKRTATFGHNKPLRSLAIGDGAEAEEQLMNFREHPGLVNVSARS